MAKFIEQNNICIFINVYMYDVNVYPANFNNNFDTMNLFKKRHYKFKDFAPNDVLLINDDNFFLISR